MKVSSSYRSTTSTSSVTTSSDPNGDSTTHTQTNDTTIGVQVGSWGTQDGDGMAATLGGDATAVGDDTLAVGTIQGNIVDAGTAVIAEGSASFTAGTETSGGDLAYASASTYGESSPADTLVIVTSTSSESLQTPDTSKWTETSKTDLLAIDLTLSNASDTSDGFNVSTGGGSDQQSSFLEGSGSIAPDDALPSDLDGNLAMIVVDATAYADDSLVLVDASALTIENELSVISGYAWFGVG
jgi:hypothetical protein